MPKGPGREKRPADVIGNAVHIMRIATGEVEDLKPDPAKEHMRRGGWWGARRGRRPCRRRSGKPSPGRPTRLAGASNSARTWADAPQGSGYDGRVFRWEVRVMLWLSFGMPILGLIAAIVITALR